MNVIYYNIFIFLYVSFFCIIHTTQFNIDQTNYLSKDLEIDKKNFYPKIINNNPTNENIDEEFGSFICSTSPRLICDQSYRKIWLYKKIEILNLLEKYNNNNIIYSHLTNNDYIIKDKYCRNILESPFLIENDLLNDPINCVWIGNGGIPKCIPISDNITKTNSTTSIVVIEPEEWKKKYFNFLQIFGCNINKYKNYMEDIKEIYICKEFCVASGYGPLYQLILLFTIILNAIDYNFLS